MKVLSLFDGISCGQIALHRAGIPVEKYYASEIDKNAIKITQKNFPNTIQLGDVTQIDFEQFAGEIDLIMGGSPCQDLSVAGNRAGLSGKRSGLFFKFVEAIRIIKPKHFLLENNVGMPDDAYEEISRLLGCYPVLINSALVSAQNRRRYYWLNWGKKDYDLFGFPICNIPQPEDKGILLQDILDNKAVSPAIIQLPHGYNTGGIKKNKVPTLTISSWENNNLLVSRLIRLSQYDLGKEQGQIVYSVKGKSVSVTAKGGGKGGPSGLYKVDLPVGDYLIRKLSPIECERLQTLPDNYTNAVSNSQRYKAIGNGWTVDVIVHIFKFLKESTK